MSFADLFTSRFGRVLTAFKKEFIWLGFFSMVANLLMLVPTLYMLQVYDRVLYSRSELTLLVLTAIVMYFFMVMGVAEWLRARLFVRVGVRIDEALNSSLFHAGFIAFLRNSSHNTVQTFNDLTNIRQFVTGPGGIALFDMPWTPLYILVMFLLHPFLGMLGLLFAGIQLVVVWKRQLVMAGKIEKASASHVDASKYVYGKLGNIDSVTSMGMLGALRQKWLARHEAALLDAGIYQQLQQREQSYGKFIRYLMQSLTLAAGAILVLRGDATSGVMIAGNVLMARALAPLDLILGTVRNFVQAREAFVRIESLLDGFKMPEQAMFTQDVRGEVRFDDVVATARQGRVPVLNGVSAIFRPGEVTVIIGPTGSGKSTLARCLTGIWPELSGAVLIDGIPVGEWDRSVIGPHIGYLPQDVELFEGTLAENIARFGTVDPEKVVRAADKAGIHEMILAFPQGYDTRISFGGQELSGGQRQRVALARALYDNASILVLDEPDANLDEAGEKALHQILRSAAAEGKTVCVISHRPGMIACANRVIVLIDGSIAHDGNRDAVLQALQKKSSKTSERAPL